VEKLENENVKEADHMAYNFTRSPVLIVFLTSLKLVCTTKLLIKMITFYKITCIQRVL
jgi:hypothetical protein